jgi:glycosyltransferase involved in cell wall biosynthesis
MQRLKVLISAYACEPHKGSEPGVGWNWVKQIARFHEVWVITRANNREAIERALKKEESMPNVHWVYFDLPDWMRFWKKGQRGVHLYYYLWQWGLYFLARRLHREVRFDLVHHVTFVNYWMPSRLALLPAPFVWGPVGGGESAPRAFYQTCGVRGRLYEHMRDLARWLARADPWLRLAARRAQVVLAATPETADQLRRLGAARVEVVSQVALPRSEWAALQQVCPRRGGPFRLLSIGHFLHLKGFHLSLRAFARLHQQLPQSEYWLIGNGPDRRRLERLATQLCISKCVKFWGALSRPRVLELLGECDVLVHPSLHDSGGWVCTEAMAAGRPIICLDLGGPALQVSEATGVKVRAQHPDQVVEDLTAALRRLAEDPDLRLKMGEAGKEWVATHADWDVKGDRMQQLYRDLGSQR